MTVIFLTTPSTTSNLTGNNLRQLIAPTYLTADATDNQIRIQLQFGAVTAGVVSAWVGEQASAGNVYNFDGNQVQLLFSGSSTATAPSNGTLISDWVSFTTYNSSKTLIVSAYFSGSSVICQADGANTVSNNAWYLSGASQVGVTAPTGAFSDSGATAETIAVMEIDMQPQFTLLGQACL